jgi:hypothetical protein
LTDCEAIDAATVFISDDAVNVYGRIVEDVCSRRDVNVAVLDDFNRDDVVRLDATAERCASCDFDTVNTFFNQVADYLFECSCLYCVVFFLVGVC